MINFALITYATSSPTIFIYALDNITETNSWLKLWYYAKIFSPLYTYKDIWPIAFPPKLWQKISISLHCRRKWKPALNSNYIVKNFFMISSRATFVYKKFFCMEKHIVISRCHLAKGFEERKKASLDLDKRQERKSFYKEYMSHSTSNKTLFFQTSLTQFSYY